MKRSSMCHLASMKVNLSLAMAVATILCLAAGCEKSPTSSSSEVEPSLLLKSSSLTSTLNQASSLTIASVTEIGAIGKPASVAVRDGGASAIIGGKLLWYFGDTIFSPASVDGTNLRANTAALANPTNPLVVSEPLDANGAPYQFVPFTPAEKAYNDSTGKPDERIALWPGSVIPDGKSNGLVFYAKWKIHPGALNYEFVGTGLAQVKKGKTVATRLSGLLFNAPEPSFGKAFILGSYVYVYGGVGNGIGVARVPLAQVRQRTAYRFWNGANWVTDVNQVQPILFYIPGGLSVSYNAYFKQYLAIHSGLFSQKVYMRTANAPEGPWSAPVEVFTGRTSASGYNYAAGEHPELVKNNGQTIFITYFNPQGSFKGELYLVEVKFQ